MKSGSEAVQEICAGIFMPYGENPQIYRLPRALLIPTYWWDWSPEVFNEFRRELDVVLDKWFMPGGSVNIEYHNKRRHEIDAKYGDSRYEEMLALHRKVGNYEDQRAK